VNEKCVCEEHTVASYGEETVVAPTQGYSHRDERGIYTFPTYLCVSHFTRCVCRFFRIRQVANRTSAAGLR